jgi:purine-binding chemotaxis protein CheW
MSELLESTLDAARVQVILQERAKRLARPPVRESPEKKLDVIVMRLGVEQYGVETQYVAEIRPAKGVTRVPGIPAFYAGLVNLRGTLYPVLDLRRYLGLDAADAPATGELVLVEVNALAVCLAVDQVLGTRAVPEADVLPLRSETSETHKARRGTTSDLITILDVPTLLSDPALVVQGA